MAALLDKLFGRGLALVGVDADKYPTFADCLSLSMRVAVCSIICALPAYVPAVFDSLPSAARNFIGFAIFTMTFTVQRYVGPTIKMALNMGIAIVLAVCNVWLYAAVCNGHRPSTTLQWVLFWAFLVAPILSVLYLNFTIRLQMTFVFFHAYFFMQLVSPRSTVDWHVTDPHCNALWLVAFAEFGLIVSLLAMCLPTVRWQQPIAINSALRAARSIGDLLISTDKLFARKAGTVVADRLGASIDRIGVQLGGLETALDGAWWESFGCGKWGQQHRQLGRLHNILTQLLDILRAIELCLASESFGDTHRRIANDDMTQASGAALAHAYRLLSCGAELSLHGGMTSADRDKFAIMAAEVRSASAEVLAAALVSRETYVVKELGGLFHADMQVERSFYFNVSRFCEAVVQAWESFEEAPRAPVKLVGLVLPAPSLAHVKYVGRNTFALVVGFLLGMFAFDFNWYVMGTQAWLLSSQKGSAHVKKCERLFGITLAGVLSSAIVDIFGTCSVSSRIGLTIVLFVYMWFAMYLHFTSRTRAYTLLCTAAFGGLFLVGENSCVASSNSTAHKLVFYDKIFSTTAGACISTAIDRVLLWETAWSRTRKHLLSAFGLVHKQLEVLFKGGADHVEALEVASRLRFEIRAAKENATEASMEHRFLYLPWPHKMVTGVIASLERLQVVLMLQDAVTPGQTTATAWDHFLCCELPLLPAFQCVGEALMATSSDTSKSFEDAINHKSEADMLGGACIAGIAETLRGPAKIDVEGLKVALNAQQNHTMALEVAECLSDDWAARSSALMFTLDQTMLNLLQITRLVLTSCP